MQRITLVLWFVFLVFLSTFAQAAEEKILALGAQETLPVSAGSKFSVGNSEVVQVKVAHLPQGGSILLIKGKAQGFSDLMVMEESGAQRHYAFRVISKRQATLNTEGQAAFSSSPGLALKPQGDGWIATGEAKTVEDWNRVKSLEARSQGKMDSLAVVHPLERLKAESRILRLFRAAGLDHLKVKGVGNLIVLEGDCHSHQQKELAEELASEVFRSVRSHLKVPFEDGGRLRYRAKIMEVMHTGAKAIGLDWDAEIPGAIQVARNFARANLSLAAGLKILEKRGLAKVLSEPELLLNEKGVAELKAGGEIPIPTHSEYTADVEWKSYGFLLRLEMPGMSSTQARTKVIVEMSGLDPANGSQGIPGLRVSRMETVVDITLGQPVMLSGLTEKRENRNLSQVPLLGDIPFIGEIFRSRDYQDNQSELAILLEADAGAQ